MEQTLEKTEVNLPADLAKRYNEAKTDQERNAILQEYAVSIGGDDLAKRGAAIMTSEQFTTLLERMGTLGASEAKKAVEEAAKEVERKYHLGASEAKEIAERSFVSSEQRWTNQRADWEMAAKVFRGIYLARQGKPDAYKRILDEEGEYHKRVYGRETRALSLGTDSSGGYLAPQLFSDMLYENIARTSLVRKFATMIPMNGNEVINIPTVTTGLSAAVVAEAAAGTNSQPVLSQKQLTTKKIMSKTRPVSIEMIEKANPAIIPLLLQWAIIEMTKAEDALVFGTTGNGIRASSTNNVVRGSAAGGYASLEFDDLVDLESALAAQYLMGDDIQGSGIIGGAPQYFIPHALMQELKKKKDTTGVYLDESRELRNQKKIFGYSAQRVLSLPDGISPALALDDKVGIFGNLGHVWCGFEPGFRVDILDQATIDDGGSPVSLGETAQASVRVIEFFDSVVVDPNALSILKLAA